MVELTVAEDVCDAHIHVGEIPDYRVSFTIDDLTKIMDKYKIARSLVFSSFVNPENVTSRLVEASRNDDRLYVLLRAQPVKYQDPQYLRTMEKLLQDKSRVVGVKINPSLERHRLTDAIYTDLLAMLDDNEAVLLLHCGRWVEMSGWHYGVEVARKHPHIKVILAHMGGTHPDLSYPAIEAARGIPNIYMDTSQTRQVFVLREGVERLGASRIFFGSDMPWGNYLQNLLGVQELELLEKDMNSILRENFNRIIGGL